jgi:predicted PurR-regulated permease PerM
MENNHTNRGIRLPKWFYWALAAMGAYVFYRVREVLLPFILSFVLAYFLDPFVYYFEKKGVKRAQAIWIVFLAGFLAVILFVAIVIPPVIRQIHQVERNISGYLRRVHSEGEKILIEKEHEGIQDQETPPPQTPGATVSSPTPAATPAPPPIASSMPNGHYAAPSDDQPMFNREDKKTSKEMKAVVEQISIFWLGLTKQYPFLKEHFGDEKTVTKVVLDKQNEIGSYALKFLGGVSSWAIESISHLLSLVLMPLLTFYFLCVLDPLRKRIIFLIADYIDEKEVDSLTEEINVMISKYFMGQLLVCSLVGLTISILASFISLFFHTKYSLLLGFITGLTALIPYFGAMISMTTGVLIGIFTSPVSPVFAPIAILVMMVLVNQTFDNFITPRIVGERVGLHPLWTLFALLSGGKIFGVAGMLIAVPIAAMIKIVLVRVYPRLLTPLPLDDFEERNELTKKEVEAQPEAKEGADSEAGVKTE